MSERDFLVKRVKRITSKKTWSPWIVIVLLVCVTLSCQFFGFPQHTITISSDGPGTITLIPNKTWYEDDEIVTFIANPPDGVAFLGWSGDIVNDHEMLQHQMKSDLSVIALFEHEEYTISPQVIGEGTIIISPNKEVYGYNEILSVRAEPAEGFTFSGWSGTLESTRNPLILTVTSSMNLLAIFEENPEVTLEGSWQSYDPQDRFIVPSVATTTSLTDVPRQIITSKQTFTPSHREEGAYDRIIVAFSSQTIKGDGYSTPDERSFLLGFGNEVKTIELYDRSISVIQLHEEASKDLEGTLREINARKEVLYAEVDYPVQAFGSPNDPLYGYQWNFEKLQAPLVWDLESGDPSVIVAIIDTGIASDLDDLTETSFVTGYNVFTDSSNTYDDHGHGTHVAGTVAQSTNNGTGCAGLAYGTTLMPIKVLGSDGTGSTSGVAQGVIWAADHGADVINLSLGGGGYTQTMYDALEYAYSQGVAIFAASGNENTNVSYPAAYDEFVIAVGATRFDDQRSYYSNYGASLDVVAPGGDVTVDQNGDGLNDGVLQQTIRYGDIGYYLFQGTSMACPHVAAVAALVRSYDSSLTVEEVYAVILDSAMDLGQEGRDDEFGYGLIQPLAAIQSLNPNPDPLYTVSDSVITQYPMNSDGLWWEIHPVAGTTVQLAISYDRLKLDHVIITVYNEDNEMLASSRDIGTSSSTKELDVDIPHDHTGKLRIAVAEE